MNLSENRLVVVDKEGTIHPYKKKIGVQHQECLDHYAKKNRYDYSNINHVVKNEENAVFYNVDRGMFVAYLPPNIEDDQLDALTSLAMQMEEITYLEVLETKEDKTHTFQEIEKNKNEIGEYFLNGVLSFYGENSEKSL